MKTTYTLSVRDVLIGCAVVGFLFCYAGVVDLLVRQWRSNEVYSHGFLIPFISAYLLHMQRDKIDRVELRPDYLGGIPALIVALLCLFAGRISGIAVLEEISIVIIFAGVIVLFFGRKLLRAVWFPVFYLLLMVPMWDIFTENAQLPFQILSATIGVKMLGLLNIPIHQNGIYIEMPGITLEVAKACSGLNYLISVVAIGIPLSYVYVKGWLKRSLVILFSAAVALVSNGLRVFLIGLFVYGGILGSDRDIHGPLHIFQALFVSVVGYVVIFITLWAVKDRIPAAKLSRDGRVSLRKRLWDHIGVAPLACVVALVLGFGALVNLYRPSPAPLARDLGLFPRQVGRWEGKDHRPELIPAGASDEFPYRKRKSADQELFRTYYSGSSLPVTLYIGYYEDQKQGKELIDYENGHMFNGAKSIELTIETGRTIRVNKYVKDNRKSRQVFLYWAQIDGLLLLDKYAEKYHTGMNALLNRRTNGAMVIFSMDVPSERGADADLDSEAEFVGKMFPIIQEYLS